jgi:hypothetical protein
MSISAAFAMSISAAFAMPMYCFSAQQPQDEPTIVKLERYANRKV